MGLEDTQIFIIGVRGSFHYPLVDKLDTYTGLALGYDISNPMSMEIQYMVMIIIQHTEVFLCMVCWSKILFQRLICRNG